MKKIQIFVFFIALFNFNCAGSLTFVSEQNFCPGGGGFIPPTDTDYCYLYDMDKKLIETLKIKKKQLYCNVYVFFVKCQNSEKIPVMPVTIAPTCPFIGSIPECPNFNNNSVRQIR